MAVRKHPAKPSGRSKTTKKAEQSVTEMIIELGRSIPPEELARFPADGARNLDHYLYGAPKEEP